MEIIYEIGIELTLFIQGLGEWLLPVMSFFTYLGVEEFYIFLAPALYWCVNSSLGLRVGLLLMVSIGINNVLKIAVHSPRPYWVDNRVTAYLPESSFGVPSGHAQNSVVFWGTIALWVKRTWYWVLSIGVIFLIGFSRIYLGVHFFHDVLLGWLIGLLILILYVWFEKPLLTWLKKIGSTKQTVTAFLFSLTIIVLTSMAVLLLGDWEIPQGWITVAAAAAPSTPIDPVSLEGVITSMGAFFGFSAGAILLNTRGGFDAGGNIWKRAVRFIIGLIGLVILYFGLSLIFPGGKNIIAYTFRYIRYAAIGLWVTGLAPVIFIKLNLADPLKKL
jgi:membrane-associated phospholipid phosphatase